MICCSVEQHGNGISHGCNWRFHISARYEEPQTVVRQSSSLPPSGRRGSYTICVVHNGRRWIQAFACVRVGVSMPRACLSGTRVSRNAADTRRAPSDSPLLGPLDSRGWGRIFISPSENARACLQFVWWVCNLSDTSWPRGRDTPEMMDNNSPFTGRERSGATGWQHCLILFNTCLLVN